MDNTTGCQLYLNKDSLETAITTAKSSEINVMVPGASPDGDWVWIFGFLGRLKIYTLSNENFSRVWLLCADWFYKCIVCVCERTLFIEGMVLIVMLLQHCRWNMRCLNSTIICSPKGSSRQHLSRTQVPKAKDNLFSLWVLSFFLSQIYLVSSDYIVEERICLFVC